MRQSQLLFAPTVRADDSREALKVEIIVVDILAPLRHVVPRIGAARGDMFSKEAVGACKLADAERVAVSN